MSELSPHARQVIEELKSAAEGPSPSVRRRLRRSVISAATGAGTVSAATLSGAKLVLVGVASAVVGSAVTVAVTRRLTAEPVAVVRPVESPRAPPGPPPIEQVAPKEREKQKTPSAPVPPRTPRGPAVGAPLPAPETPETPEVPAREPEKLDAPEDLSLAAEMSSLSALMELEDRAFWNEALTGLDAHGERFKNGTLVIEAAALRVIALCGIGRVAEAQALARELERRSPLNPAVRRLQSTCARAHE